MIQLSKYAWYHACALPVPMLLAAGDCYSHGRLYLPHEPSLAQSWLRVALRPSVLAFDAVYNQSEL